MKPVFKVVIFDLDDTLYDCTRQLIPNAVRDMCRAMVAAGLATDLESAVHERARHLRSNPREDSLAHLVSFFGVLPETGATAKSVKDAGHQAFFCRSVPTHITPFDDTRPVLKALMPDCRLHLVTSGHPPTQAAKIEILDLASFFNTVRVIDPSRGERKRDVFREIVDNTDVRRSDCLVVGDRLDSEISEAAHLGMCTCHVRHGEFRHMTPRDEWETPDFTVAKLTELIPICLPNQAN